MCENVAAHVSLLGGTTFSSSYAVCAAGSDAVLSSALEEAPIEGVATLAGSSSVSSALGMLIASASSSVLQLWPSSESVACSSSELQLESSAASVAAASIAPL